eukprot:scaffold70023_cov39-Phaeocystis_antarctica.AAC.1
MAGRAACLDSRSRPTSSLPPPRADVRLDPAWTLLNGPSRDLYIIVDGLYKPAVNAKLARGPAAPPSGC